MGKKKSLREVLLRHPELFDLVQLLTDGDDLMADEDKDGETTTHITISRDGKHKKKKCNEVTFVRVQDGYLIRTQSSPVAIAVKDETASSPSP